MVLSDEERKAKDREYHNTPEYKARAQERKKSPHYKEVAKKYRNRPENKERERASQRTPEYREKANARYARPENIAKAKEYNAKPETKLRKKRQHASPEYVAQKKEYRTKPETKKKIEMNRLRPENIEKRVKQQRSPEHRAKKAVSNAKLRLKVLQTYSKRLSNNNIPCCRCCGENSHIDFLALDHIAGKNKMNYEPELVKLGYSSKLLGSSLYVWLRDNGFPEGFQVLCINCNYAKGMKKNKNKCPHEKQRLEETFDRMTTQSSFEL